MKKLSLIALSLASVMSVSAFASNSINGVQVGGFSYEPINLVQTGLLSIGNFTLGAPPYVLSSKSSNTQGLLSQDGESSATYRATGTANAPIQVELEDANGGGAGILKLTNGSENILFTLKSNLPNNQSNFNNNGKKNFKVDATSAPRNSAPLGNWIGSYNVKVVYR